MLLVITVLISLLATLVHAQEIHPDIVVVLNVTGGVTPGGRSWADSYSVGDECFCATTFDHNIGPFYVETPLGWKTVFEICELLGPGPGNTGDRPVYNDIQCGNSPPNNAGDEHICPGRTDLGEAGCGHIGPRWKFDNLFAGTSEPPTVPSDAHPDIVAVLNVTDGIAPNATMADSYSVGDRCYCASTFENGIGDYFVETPMGWMTVREVCDLLGPGPGATGRPLYNDIQCGNGPPSAEGDEHVCPGRVDIVDGCGHIGPKWNFVEAGGMASFAPSMTSSIPSTESSFVESMTPTSVPVPAGAPPTSAPVALPLPTSGCERYVQSLMMVALLTAGVGMATF